MSDLVVAYRVYPGVSKVPPVFYNDKYKLARLCLESFKESLRDLDVEIYAILDSCPEEYARLFEEYFPNTHFIRLDDAGNQATFKCQIEVLLKQKESDIIYFAEDDYFYLPDRFREMLKFLEEDDVHFITPYDHLDYYNHPLHKHERYTRKCGNIEWRTVASTCLTFLTTKKVLKETENIMETYVKGNFDASLWISLTKINTNPINALKALDMIPIIGAAWIYCWKQILFGKRYLLWAPRPSIATHMENTKIAPSVDWENIIMEKAKKIDPKWDDFNIGTPL